MSVYDPIANSKEIKRYYGINLVEDIKENAPYNGIVVAVKHKEFLDFKAEQFKKLLKDNPIFVNIKGIYPKEKFDKRSIYWRL